MGKTAVSTECVNASINSTLFSNNYIIPVKNQRRSSLSNKNSMATKVSTCCRRIINCKCSCTWSCKNNKRTRHLIMYRFKNYLVSCIQIMRSCSCYSNGMCSRCINTSTIKKASVSPRRIYTLFTACKTCVFPSTQSLPLKSYLLLKELMFAL